MLLDSLTSTATLEDLPGLADRILAGQTDGRVVVAIGRDRLTSPLTFLGRIWSVHGRTLCSIGQDAMKRTVFPFLHP